VRVHLPLCTSLPPQPFHSFPTRRSSDLMSPLSSIPAGHYAGNLRDVIWTYQLEIRQDETWHKYDIPYFNYGGVWVGDSTTHPTRSEEHTSELQSRVDLVCRLLLEKKT